MYSPPRVKIKAMWVEEGCPPGVKIEVNVGGRGAYPPPRVKIEVNKDGRGLGSKSR